MTLGQIHHIIDLDTQIKVSVTCYTDPPGDEHRQGEGLCGQLDYVI